MIVNQVHQLFHQLAKRPIGGKPGEYGQKTRVATCENTDRPHVAGLQILIRHRLPQGVALLAVKRLQLVHGEQFVPCPAGMRDLIETGGCCPQQHDPRLVDQSVAQLPCRLRRDLLAQHIQVFDNQQQALTDTFSKVEELRDGAFAQPGVLLLLP